MLALRRQRLMALPGGPALWAVVAASWALTVALITTGRADLVSHDALLGSGARPGIGQLLLFLAAWQVMTGAMMLPSSLPVFGLFRRLRQGQARPHLALAAFLAAYFAVWTGFALLALTGDAGIHQLVDHWRWLDAHPYLIAGTVLLLAGLFQFSPLKASCLTACRNPVGFLWRTYGRGIRRAWQIGARHGLFCLGCCWALMLVMFAVGVGSLAWMAALTGVMAIEKTAPWGRRLVPVVGVTLVVWGLLLVVQPAWLPGFVTLAAGSD